jgi:hypothetical protein
MPIFQTNGGNSLMMIDTLTAMRQCPFFEEFQPKHMEKLMALGTQVEFEKDEIIFHEEDESHLFYVILTGRVVLEAHYAGSTFRRRWSTASANCRRAPWNRSPPWLSKFPNCAKPAATTPTSAAPSWSGC